MNLVLEWLILEIIHVGVTRCFLVKIASAILTQCVVVIVIIHIVVNPANGSVKLVGVCATVSVQLRLWTESATALDYPSYDDIDGGLVKFKVGKSCSSLVHS